MLYVFRVYGDFSEIERLTPVTLQELGSALCRFMHTECMETHLHYAPWYMQVKRLILHGGKTNTSMGCVCRISIPLCGAF